MAKNLPESGAFEAAGGADRAAGKNRLASRSASGASKATCQLNCRIDSELSEPLAIARIKEGKTSGEIVGPLLREWLTKRGYLS